VITYNGFVWFPL